MSNHRSLSRLLEKGDFPSLDEKTAEARLETLQHRMVRIQQGIWHRKGRAIIAVEGFDAAGKGGAIREIVEKIDPRGVRVHAIGPPTAEEQGTHWLYRFWLGLPRPGTIAIFDRTWYGRVLVERVEKLIDKAAWKRAYREIEAFERMLVDDGIDLIKIFLAISKREQWKRFEARLDDPYKQWKLTDDDLHARKKWSKYVEAVDAMFRHTDTEGAPWHLVPADDKGHARVAALEHVTENLGRYASWIEGKAAKRKHQSTEAALAALK